MHSVLQCETAFRRDNKPSSTVHWTREVWFEAHCSNGFSLTYMSRWKSNARGLTRYRLLVKILCQHKIGHFGDVPQDFVFSIPQEIGLVWKKQNLTQQKHTFTNQKKCTTTQNRHKKTKARFSRLLWHPAWKRRWPILVSELHKFVTYLLTYTLTYSPRPIWGGLIRLQAIQKLLLNPVYQWRFTDKQGSL